MQAAGELKMAMTNRAGSLEHAKEFFPSIHALSLVIRVTRAVHS